ncbi:phenylacetate--CoA ligase family protein [Methanofollis formosanus]|uniref:Phenylacetate--CoA ligase family protein n=1 Tax=Methanofollis formosanus TaxID=299308 RepID=A0A8G1EH45_9EURY|nr:phenylacetate--CoA ligase family protein [Methanofollis formosanus]QYZ79859.1 phenylacetate--CoA ligase family protein [Methanofollis formosanus]
MGAFNACRLLMQARKNQWLKPSELEELQAKRLRAMVRHAYENTEFYHCKFKNAGIRPEDIRTVDDLEKVPFTTKDELRKNSTGSMIARGVDLGRCLVTETSGSTGIPTRVVYDSPANDFSKAINLRSHIENGLTPTSKWTIFGDPHHFPKPTWFQKFGIFSPRWISVFDPVEKQLEFLQKFKPDVLGGYTSSIVLLARAIEERGIEGITPKAVIGTSELLDPGTREYIDAVFHIRMIDHFGCVELNRTAWECGEHAGYHIDVDAVVMEFVRGGKAVAPGERGEIVYTGLYNYAMPLIRYNIEDIGVPADELCPCGRGLPLMKIIEGRSDSFMQTPDGRIFAAMIWEPLMRRIPGITMFKAIQEREDLIRILVVGDEVYSAATARQIVHDVQEVMGEEVRVDVEVVEEIPRDPSGKVRCAVSKVGMI